MLVDVSWQRILNSILPSRQRLDYIFALLISNSPYSLNHCFFFVFLFQEVFQDPNRDESFIVELLELKENVADAGSARWFLEDLAVEQASENSLVCLPLL